MRVSHTQWCSRSLAAVPGTEAAPAQETAAGTGSLSFFAVEKLVWVHTFLLLLFLASGATAQKALAAQKSGSFSQICISPEGLFQQDPFIYAEEGCSCSQGCSLGLQRCAYTSGLPQASHAAVGLQYHHALPPCVQGKCESLFVRHSGSGSTKYL